MPTHPFFDLVQHASIPRLGMMQRHGRPTTVPRPCSPPELAGDVESNVASYASTSRKRSRRKGCAEREELPPPPGHGGTYRAWRHRHEYKKDPPPPPAGISRVLFSRRTPCDQQIVTYVASERLHEEGRHKAWKNCVPPVAERVLRK